MYKYKVWVYMKDQNIHSFNAGTIEKGREVAKRIITEGLWRVEPYGPDGEFDAEVFYPVHTIYKVRVMPDV